LQESTKGFSSMGSVIHEPPESRRRTRETEDSGHGGMRNLAPAEGNFRAVADQSPHPARTGIWVALSAITMSFAAFTSALIVGRGSAVEWGHIVLPPVLYFNTLALIASSITLEIARRRFTGNVEIATSLRWFYATLLLGLIFVCGQYAAWLRLRAEGLYLATSPTSSYFYVLTAVHALHVLGGLGGLVRVVRKLGGTVPSLRRATLDATSYYWHFMGILWLYLLLVLWMKL
jgi:cytochrome c oxidase subunit III